MNEHQMAVKKALDTLSLDSYRQRLVERARQQKQALEKVESFVKEVQGYKLSCRKTSDEAIEILWDLDDVQFHICYIFVSAIFSTDYFDRHISSVIVEEIKELLVDE